MLSRFKQKILSKKISDCKISEVGGNFRIKNSCAEGQINFYELENIVIEMSVTNLADGENKFYLHFELRDLDYATELFEEMLKTLSDLKNQQRLKVLLTCTGGLTTGFFADKLNQAAKILSLNLEFSAAPFNKIPDVAEDYQIILLAPQVSYQLENLQKILPDKKIFKIPTKIFASYNSAAMINFVREISAEKTTLVKELIMMKDFIKNLAKRFYTLAEIAKQSWIEGSKFWSYEDYQKIL